MGTINYSVYAMRKPGDKTAAPKYYPKMQATGVVEINALAEDISYSTTLTDGDVLNVIRALIKQICRHISDGRIVKLENFGTFQFQISSDGAETEAKYNPEMVRSVNIQFRPGVGIQEAQNLKKLSFHKVPKKSAKATDTTDGGTTGDSGNTTGGGGDDMAGA